MQTLHKNARSVQAVLDEYGVVSQVSELPASTRTAKDAAIALGCDVAQIVKSLIFTTASAQPLLVLTSGVNQVNECLIAKRTGECIKRADPKWVKQITGFAIGGVPPIGHKTVMPVFLDKFLLRYPKIWAAAGTPHAVFSIAPNTLLEITGAEGVEW